MYVRDGNLHWVLHVHTGLNDFEALRLDCQKAVSEHMSVQVV